MSLEHILLGLLRKPASGYDLEKAITEGFTHFWAAKLSQIYPTLQRLVDDGLLKCRVEPPDKGPAKKVYRRTTKGTKELEKWLRQGPIVGQERVAYVAQLVNLQELDDLEETLRFLQELLTFFRNRLAVIEEIERVEVSPAEMAGAGPEDSEAFHQYVALRMGLHVTRARIAALEESIERVQKRKSMQTKKGPVRNARTRKRVNP